ncbi:MAG: flagellar export protein FliJ [Gammaproteobacteria bacterium]|nr:flagellar export protein FliJ [Pseudomonadales bacterium]MCP5349057.1 flagellar export protein FliJ [Pseudomonadales bacterium]
MKRSERIDRLHRINKLQEELAAANHGSVLARYESLRNQLDKLQDYWSEYSARLEELKQSTSSVRDLQEYHRFLGKLEEAIAQQSIELEACAEALSSAEQELVERGVEAKKMEKASAGIREQEDARERQKLQKESDELAASRF